MNTKITHPQAGDVVRDKWAVFYRVTPDGKFEDISDPNRAFIHDEPLIVNTVQGPVTILLRDGVSTGHGDALATRVAAFLVNDMGR